MLKGKQTIGFILCALAVIGSSGCVTEYNLATRQTESLLYGTDKEISIGEGVAKQFDANFKMNTDVDINERVRRILERIVAVCDRTELIYTVKIIDEDKVNAVSLPGGPIYVFKGLVDKVANDDELAGVIAHEVGHIAAKHGMKKLQASYGYTLLQLLAVSSGDANLAQGTQTAYLALFLAFSREDEFQADQLAVRYMREAGYNPRAMVDFLIKLKEEQHKAPLATISYWRTHPYIGERIAMANKEITGQLGFKDYLNLTGNE
ncbi:MAG: M48 family metallopeptidase [Candidatus Omnitrophota bacterium]